MEVTVEMFSLSTLHPYRDPLYLLSYYPWVNGVGCIRPQLLTLQPWSAKIVSKTLTNRVWVRAGNPKALFPFLLKECLSMSVRWGFSCIWLHLRGRTDSFLGMREYSASFPMRSGSARAFHRSTPYLIYSACYQSLFLQQWLIVSSSSLFFIWLQWYKVDRACVALNVIHKNTILLIMRECNNGCSIRYAGIKIHYPLSILFVLCNALMLAVHCVNLRSLNILSM